MFKDDIEGYINKLCEKNKPKYIIVNTIYYPYECDDGSWANPALTAVHYTNTEGINKFKKLIRLIYVHATCEIKIDNSIIIPIPLFEVLDSSEQSIDFLHRVEPSIKGGMKMAEKLKMIQI